MAKADGFVLDSQEHLSSKLIFDNSTSNFAHLKLFMKSFMKFMNLIIISAMHP